MNGPLCGCVILLEFKAKKWNSMATYVVKVVIYQAFLHYLGNSGKLFSINATNIKYTLSQFYIQLLYKPHLGT